MLDSCRAWLRGGGAVTDFLLLTGGSLESKPGLWIPHFDLVFPVRSGVLPIWIRSISTRNPVIKGQICKNDRSISRNPVIRVRSIKTTAPISTTNLVIRVRSIKTTGHSDLEKHPTGRFEGHYGSFRRQEVHQRATATSKSTRPAGLRVST